MWSSIFLMLDVLILLRTKLLWPSQTKSNLPDLAYSPYGRKHIKPPRFPVSYSLQLGKVNRVLLNSDDLTTESIDHFLNQTLSLRLPSITILQRSCQVRVARSTENASADNTRYQWDKKVVELAQFGFVPMRRWVLL